MFGTQNFMLFLMSGILLNLTPGQDTFYILGRSLAQGRRAGILSVLGITSGSAVHTVAAAFGVSAILAASAKAFLVVKLLGAVYLVYLGIGMLVSRSANDVKSGDMAHKDAWAVYRAGFFTNLLNPKVALFFMAFLTQFVDPTAPSKITVLLFLGGVFMCTGTIWCLILACCASAMSHRLRRSPSLGVMLKRVAGALFVGLGVKLAFSK